MKLGLLGIGLAGGHVVDQLLEHEHSLRKDIAGGAIAVNTATVDLQTLTHLEKSHRLAIGLHQTRGKGTGADLSLAGSVIEQDLDAVQAQVEQDLDLQGIDAFLVAGALGGGTGGAGLPLVGKALSHVYSKPVYGVGILPGENEKSLYSENASWTYQRATAAFDALFLFDNGAWDDQGKRHTPDYDALNDALVRRLTALFAADFDGNNPHLLPASLCTTDIASTLGAGDVTTIGYASRHLSELKTGLLKRLAGHRNRDVDVHGTTLSTVKKALHGRFTVPCDPTEADTALLAVSAPEQFLSQEALHEATDWLEGTLGSCEIRSGIVASPTACTLSATIVLSGVSNVPRVVTLRTSATETTQSVAGAAAHQQ